jgi:hypothetical protein
MLTIILSTLSNKKIFHVYTISAVAECITAAVSEANATINAFIQSDERANNQTAGMLCV